MTMRSSIWAAALVLSVTGATVQAGIVDTRWTAGVDAWGDIDNWDMGFPSSWQIALITNGGTAQVTQPGETHNTLILGEDNGESGSLEILSGSLIGSGLRIGYHGSGSVSQSDGTLTLGGTMHVGRFGDGSGTYTMSGGSVQVSTILLAYEGGGTLNIADAGVSITITKLLEFGPRSVLETVPGSRINLDGASVANRSRDPLSLDGMSGLGLVFEGGAGDWDTLQVAGTDIGADSEGYNCNFGLGELILGGDGIGQLCLIDDFDNQPGWEGAEALYVTDLVVGPGSLLDLNGLNLYYLSSSIDPTATIAYNGGALICVPEPATLGLLAIGAAALVRRRVNR